MNQSSKTIRFQAFAAVSQDSGDVLGKLLYFSLSSILIDKDTFSEICDGIGFPYKPSKRKSDADAFRSATGDVFERKLIQNASGPQLIKVYCRDNNTSSGVLSRELVKETVHEDTNEYKKLANISLDRSSGFFCYGNFTPDDQVDAMPYCMEAQRLFELYRRCIGRGQLETILTNYVDSMQAVKLSRGHNYFMPRDFMVNITLFEDLIELLEENNLLQKPNRSPLDANSIYVVDDAKQRKKMAAAFYRTVREEIAEYEKRATNLIQGGNRSPSIMDRCILAIRGLEEKKAHYEDILKQELHDLDEQFTSLRYLSDELQIRARGLRAQKRAA